MNRIKHRPCWGWWLLRLSVLCCLLVLFGCSSEPRKVWQGYVEGEFVYIGSPIGGRVVDLSVVKGQQVTAGQPLFILEQEPHKSTVTEAEKRVVLQQSNLDNLTKGKRPSELSAIRARLDRVVAAQKLAEIEYKRLSRLVQTKSAAKEQLDRAASQLEQSRYQVAEVKAELVTARTGARVDEIDAARAALEAARAQLVSAQWNLEQKNRKAPCSGLVVDTLYRPGEWVPGGRPVVSLLPPENRKIRFYVPEPIIASISPGQNIFVYYDGAAAPVQAVISFVAPQAEYTPPVIYSSQSRAKLVFLVEARANPEDALQLKPGQPVDVSRSPMEFARGKAHNDGGLLDKIFMSNQDR